MQITYGVTFDSPYQADRAMARLRKQGIRLNAVETQPRQPRLERSLFVAYPYGRSFQGTNNKTANSIPYTSGDTLLMPTPFFTRQDDGPTRLRLRMPETDAGKAKALLINSGGRELRRFAQ